MNLKKISTKVKLSAVAAVILIVITSALVINKEKMSSKVDDTKLSSIPVNVTKMKIQTVTEKISSVGTILADNDVTIISETQGKVLKVHVKAGDKVESGTLIVTIDDELKLAAYLTAKGMHEKADLDLARLTKLHKENFVSDSDFENAKLNATNARAQFIVAQRQLNDTKIKSPIHGIVSDRYVNVGETIALGTPVANVIDIDRLKIKIYVQETDVFKMKRGDGVEVITDNYPGKIFTGTVDSVGAKGDAAHNFPVTITMNNTSASPLKAGMTAKVNFSSVADHEIKSIPRTALIGSVKEPQVFTVEGNIAKLKSIVIGGEYGNEMEVLSGLSSDDLIVINGQNNLSDNTEVTILK